MAKEFTVQDGIAYQNEELAKWKTVLTDDIYQRLVKYVTRNNHEAETGFNVCRGGDIDFIVKLIASNDTRITDIWEYEIANK